METSERPKCRLTSVTTIYQGIISWSTRKHLRVRAINDWESSGFYPAELEAEKCIRSLQEYVPDDVATDRLIGLLDHTPAAKSHATMVDIPDGII